MQTSVKQGAQTEMTPELARRNVRMAIVHFLIAVGFLAAFVWSVSHRG